jgi:MFS family permease
LGVSSFSPAIGDVANNFHVSNVAATLPLTLYVLGQALGPCIAAPLSETYGRKGVFLITSPIGILFTLGSGFSQNYGSLCTLRFLAGFFSSPSLSVGGGIIVDIFKPIDRSPAIALWVGSGLLGTGLGPMLAGFAVQNRGWRWTQWIFIFATLAGWIPSLFTSESYMKIILARRVKILGQASPPNIVAGGFAAKVKFFLTITLFRPIIMLFQEPIVAYFTIYISVIFSILFSFFDAFPLVFGGVYGFSLGGTGISFLGLFIGVAIGIITHIVIDRLTYRKFTLARQARGDFTHLPPEHRLYPAMIGAPLISISMFWFGWSSRASTHWISSEIATVIFGMGTVGVGAPCLQYRK